MGDRRLCSSCELRLSFTKMFRGAFRATRARRMFQGQDAWRDHKYVNVNENMKVQHMLPGFTNAVGIFSVYLVLDAAAGAISAQSKAAHEGAKAAAELRKLKKEHGIED